MASIYESDQAIPQFSGRVQNGRSVLVESMTELLALKALCKRAPAPPETPLSAIYRALGPNGAPLARWAEWAQREAPNPDAPTIESKVSQAEMFTDWHHLAV